MVDSSKTVSVIGAGYVGLTTAVLLAQAGHTVYLIEKNPERLKTIQSGKSFFYELGIDALLEPVISSQKLIATDSYKESIPNSSVVFSCVGTPDNPDGSSNLDYVFAAAEETAKFLNNGCIYVQKSTVPVGTGEHVKTAMQKNGKQFIYLSNPEFLREGTAIADSLWFDRIVVGGDDPTAVDVVINLYKELESRRDEIAKVGYIEPVNNSTGKYIATNLNSAELIKVTANAFLALKISFANSIAKLADRAEADINDVMDAVGADQRIGRAFLNAGRGYGGGCFPKDVSGLISSANQFGVELQIMTAASDLNESMPGYIVNKVKNLVPELHTKKCAVLGLAFKAGTSDARKSPGVKIANLLQEIGARVSAYDPKANREATEDLHSQVNIMTSLDDTVTGADVVLVATNWPEFVNFNLRELTAKINGKVFVDCMNAFDIDEVEFVGLKYIGVGRNGKSIDGKH